MQALFVHLRHILMDKFEIDVLKDKDVLTFEIIDYAHSDAHDLCTFEVLKNGTLIASFEPDYRGFLHICKNTGVVDEETLHLIADKLELRNID